MGSLTRRRSTFRMDPLESRVLFNSVVDDSFDYSGLADINTLVTNDAELAPDGSLYIGGYDWGSGTPTAFVAKYDSTGRLDPSYNFGQINYFDEGRFGSSQVLDLTLDPDGNLAVVGDAAINLTTGEAFPYRTRILADGTVDPSVDIVGRGYNMEASTGVVVESDGTVVIANTGRYPVDPITWGSLSGQYYSTLRGYTSSYHGDFLFGESSDVESGYTQGFAAFGDVTSGKLAQQPDGSLFLAGSIRNAGQSGYIATVAKFTSRGLPLGTANIDAPSSTSERATNLIIQPDGKAIVVGQALVGSDNDFLVARLNADGTLDTTFDDDGIVTVDFDLGDDLAMDASVQPDGQIIIAGTSDGNAAIVALNPDGSRDTGFGTNGKFVDSAFTVNSFSTSDLRSKQRALSLAASIILASRGDGTGVLGRSADNGSTGRTSLSRVLFDHTAPEASVDTTVPIGDADAGIAAYVFNVTYTDNIRVESTSVANSTILVTGPGGFSTTATLVSQTPSDGGKTVVATYRFNAPGGTWDIADNGIYTLDLAADIVKDPAGLATTAASNTLSVNISTNGGGGGGTPTAQLTGELKASAPFSGVGGQKGKISAKVTTRNPNLDVVAGTVTVQLYLSSDTTPGVDDTSLGSQTRDVQLKSGKSKSFSIKSSIIPNLPDGVYNLLAVVVGTDGNQADVVVGQSIAIASPFVDLTAASPTLGHADGSAGDREKASLRLTNAGNITASGTINVIIRTTVNGVSQDLAVIPTKIKLSPGKSKKLSLKFTIPDSLALGTYSFDLFADGTPLADRTEANNLVSAGGYTVV